jgi:hypothetical protein
VRLNALSLSLGLALAFALPGCRAPRFDTPETAYASFSSALLHHEYKTAYDALSTETRKAIEAKSKEISTTSGGAVADEPTQLAFGTGSKPSAITEIKVVRQEGDAATVSVTAGGHTSEQKLVKEGAAWKVDLSESFKK